MNVRVEVEVTYKKVVSVEARSPEEATTKVKRMVINKEIAMGERDIKECKISSSGINVKMGMY